MTRASLVRAVDAGVGDPLAILAAVAVVVAAGLIASYLPTRRVVRIDPLAAIRHD